MLEHWKKKIAKYLIDCAICKTYSISTGSFYFMQGNVFMRLMPKKIVTGLLENAALNRD